MEGGARSEAKVSQVHSQLSGPETADRDHLAGRDVVVKVWWGGGIVVGVNIQQRQ